MATIKAFIRTSTKDKKLVNVRFRLTDGRDVQLFHKSEIKVSPYDFDAKNEKIKAKIIFDAKLRKFIDDSISDRKKLIRELYIQAPDKSVLTSAWLDEAIDRDLNPDKYIDKETPAPDKQTLLAHVADFISKAPYRMKKKTNTAVTKGTLVSYKANQKRLIAFLKYKKRENMLLSEINEKFYTDYMEFLTNRKRNVKRSNGEIVNTVRQYTNNTIGDAIKVFKTMISDVKGLDIKMKDFYAPTDEVDHVYLSEEELQKIKDLDLSDKPILDNARDWFLLLSWTGSRYSDADKIDPANINNNMISYRQQKTNKKVVIPVHNVVNEILQKRNNQMPKIPFLQDFNPYIRRVCKLAGIDSMESITRTVGGKLITETKPKYELISSHTCRRSFCTNQYKRGLDTLMIRSISGHKTDKSFLKYIKVSEEEHAEMMAKKWNEIYKQQ